MLDGELAIKRLDAAWVWALEGERLKPRPRVGNRGHIAGVAPVVDDRRRQTTQRKRSILRDGESETRVPGWKRNLVAEDRAVGCKNGIDGSRIGDPAPQAATSFHSDLTFS